MTKCCRICDDCRFTKIWRVQNNGDESWPSGCCLQFTGGTLLQCEERVLAPPLPPSASTDLCLHMTSPAQPGMFQSKWRMITPTGSYFGGQHYFFIMCSRQTSCGLEFIRSPYLIVRGTPTQNRAKVIFRLTGSQVKLDDDKIFFTKIKKSLLRNISLYCWVPKNYAIHYWVLTIQDFR